MQHNGEVLRKLSEEIGVNIFAIPYVLILLNSPNNSVQRRFGKNVIRYIRPEANQTPAFKPCSFLSQQFFKGSSNKCQQQTSSFPFLMEKTAGFFFLFYSPKMYCIVWNYRALTFSLL